MRQKLIFHEDLESLKNRIPNFTERIPNRLDDGTRFNTNLTDSLEIIEIPIGQIVWLFSRYRGWDDATRQVTQDIRANIQQWSDHRYMYENHVWNIDDDDLYEVISVVSRKLKLDTISWGNQSDYRDLNMNKHILVFTILFIKIWFIFQMGILIGLLLILWMD